MNDESIPGSRLTVVYTRQSRSTGSSFSSCDAQYAICVDTADAMGWPVHDHFSDEGESSETLQRPSLGELIDAIKERLIERVIVYSVDRLARRLALLSELLALFEEYEVDLVVVTDPDFGQSAASRLMTNIVAAASEFQQDLTRDRLAEMRSAMKQHGKRVAGQIPFGYTTAGGSSKLVPHEKNSIVIRDLFALAAKGAKPSDIVSIANISQWKDRYGNAGRWTTTRIMKLLSNRTYVGEIRVGDSFRPGEHVALVARDVFDRVQQHIADRQTRAPGQRPRKIVLPLIDVLVCGLCDRPMTSSYSKRGNIRYVYYRCRSQAGGRPPCANVSVGAYQLEKFVCDTMSDLGNDDDPDILAGFSSLWKRVPESEQRKLLPSLLTRVVFDSQSQTVNLEFNEGEVDRFRQHMEQADARN